MYYFSCNSAAQLAVFQRKRQLLRKLGPDKICVIVMFGFDKTLAEEYAIVSGLRKMRFTLFLQQYMPVGGRSDRRPANYFNLDIDRIAAIRFGRNGQNNEKFLTFVSDRYFETFGQYYLPLLEARYRYNSKTAINRYLRDPSLVTRRKHSHFAGLPGKGDMSEGEAG